jgi:AcrR family transcriptional regulator
VEPEENGAAAPRRGRPRSEQARRAILEAASELLVAQGLAAVSVATVAARAGVSKATIYRRWHTKELLALDALFHAWADARPPARATGQLHADLLSLLRPWVELLRKRPYGHLVASLLAEAQTNAGFAEQYWLRLVGPRREEARALINRAIEREPAAGTDFELALDLLYGPIYHRLFHGHAPLDEPFLHALVDSAVAVLEPARVSV